MINIHGHSILLNWLGKIILKAIEIKPNWTHSVEEHTVSNAGLDVLWPGVTRVFPQQAPRSGLAVVGVQAAELRLRRPTVLHAAVTRQDATAKRVDHVLLWVHAHLPEEQGAEDKTGGNRKCESSERGLAKDSRRSFWFSLFIWKD